MRIYNLTDNDDVAIVAQQGIFQVMEWKRDFSVTYGSAMDAYYASEMNVRRRQLVCNLNGKTGAVVQAGAMQWAVGHIEVTTGVKGVGDFIGKLARGAVTNESAVKPEYQTWVQASLAIRPRTPTRPCARRTPNWLGVTRAPLDDYIPGEYTDLLEANPRPARRDG